MFRPFAGLAAELLFARGSQVHQPGIRQHAKEFAGRLARELRAVCEVRDRIPPPGGLVGCVCCNPQATCRRRSPTNPSRPKHNSASVEGSLTATAPAIRH